MSSNSTPGEPTPNQHSRRPRRARRALAIAAGVAMVPALYAAASAATGGGGGSATLSAADHTAGATELETEHGVVVAKPHGGATTPSVPEATSPTQPQVTTPTVPTSPTTPTTPGPEIEHPVPEPGDDKSDDAVITPAPSGTQSFSSAGGSITVTVTNGMLSLTASSPAAGFTADVHDNGPSRVEVRFSDGQTEWRIRIELDGGALTSEITHHD
jgi:hypothetical protein